VANNAKAAIGRRIGGIAKAMAGSLHRNATFAADRVRGAKADCMERSMMYVVELRDLPRLAAEALICDGRQRFTISYPDGDVQAFSATPTVQKDGRTIVLKDIDNG
jgi:hypothetical protein